MAQGKHGSLIEEQDRDYPKLNGGITGIERCYSESPRLGHQQQRKYGHDCSCRESPQDQSIGGPAALRRLGEREQGHRDYRSRNDRRDHSPGNLEDWPRRDNEVRRDRRRPQESKQAKRRDGSARNEAENRDRQPASRERSSSQQAHATDR